MWKNQPPLENPGTTGYGVLFYAFPVLAPSITADTGWSLTAVTALFSAS
ncbi:hypothetical protein HGB46_24150, partial [Nocardiopsis dassonvillei]|nr:hypothetical protein [Nocardiopsis dassonvillei]